MIYLASPYSYKADAELMHLRYEQALAKTAELTLQGLAVFSPIVSSHQLSLAHEMPTTWDFWSGVDYKFLDASSELYVLMLDCWDKSAGVTAEIEYAKEIGLPITYIV